jgi:hypothetical protein
MTATVSIHVESDDEHLRRLEIEAQLCREPRALVGGGLLMRAIDDGLEPVLPVRRPDDDPDDLVA